MKTTLQLTLGANAVVFDYATDFDELWRMELSSDNVVVLYARTPGDGRVSPVNTAQFLSPLIWALCAKSAGKVRRVAILYDASARHSALSGLHHYFDLLRQDALPWLRVAQSRDLRFDDVVRFLGFDVDIPDEAAARDTVATLLDALRQRLTDSSAPDDRHAISNLVGPFLLLGRQPTSVGDASNAEADHIAALLRVLIACGLSKVDAATTPVAEPVQLSFPLGTRLFILDDQWRHGWGEWVCSQVAGVGFEPPRVIGDGWTCISSASSQTAVFASADPSVLLGSPMAPGPLRLTAGKRDKRFELSVGGDGNTTDVLLLDIRLFAGGGPSERSWTNSLIELCRLFEGEGYAWPGFRKDELDEIQAWAVENDPGQPQAASVATRARGLIGRLVALTDLSLPIVLFSSTADADYLEQFRDYGNVITTFHKPRTFGPSADDDRDYFATILRIALGQASVLINARSLVRLVQKWAREGRAKAVELEATAGAPDDRWTYAEVYVDESGTGGGNITKAGGYIVLYKDTDAHPLQYSSSLSTRWGVGRENPFVSTGFRPKATAIQYSQRDDAYRQAFVDVAGTAQTTNAGLAACVVQGTHVDNAQTSLAPDPGYRTLAATLVEFFLYDWLPALSLCWTRTLRAGVFLGTRIWPADARELLEDQWRFGMPLLAFPPDNDQAPNARVLAKVNYDAATVETTYGYRDTSPIEVNAAAPDRVLHGQSLATSDAQALVLNIARERGAGAPVHRAVAVTLRYKGGSYSPPTLPRQIHYASDDFLHKVGFAREPLSFGFSATLSPGLSNLLRASRAFDSQLTVADGLRHLSLAAAAAPQNLGDLPLWVAVRCEPLIARMKGRDFIDFAANKLPYSSLLLQASHASQRTPSAAAQPKAKISRPTPHTVHTKKASPVFQPAHKRQWSALTRDVVEKLFTEYLPALAKDFSVKAVFSDPAWCVLALDGRNDVCLPLPTLSKTDRETGVQAFKCNWKLVTWSDDAIALANQILNQKDGSAEYDNETIFVGPDVSDVKVRAIGELTRQTVKKRPPLPS